MLKVDSLLKTVPIFPNGCSDADEGSKGSKEGVDDYLTKPFDNREVVAAPKPFYPERSRRRIS